MNDVDLEAVRKDCRGALRRATSQRRSRRCAAPAPPPTARSSRRPDRRAGREGQGGRRPRGDHPDPAPRGLGVLPPRLDLPRPPQDRRPRPAPARARELRRAGRQRRGRHRLLAGLTPPSGRRRARPRRRGARRAARTPGARGSRSTPAWRVLVARTVPRGGARRPAGRGEHGARPPTTLRRNPTTSPVDVSPDVPPLPSRSSPHGAPTCSPRKPQTNHRCSMKARCFSRSNGVHPDGSRVARCSVVGQGGRLGDGGLAVPVEVVREHLGRAGRGGPRFVKLGHLAPRVGHWSPQTLTAVPHRRRPAWPPPRSPWRPRSPRLNSLTLVRAIWLRASRWAR